jgi:hypothetical protein
MADESVPNMPRSGEFAEHSAPRASGGRSTGVNPLLRIMWRAFALFVTGGLQRCVTADPSDVA